MKYARKEYPEIECHVCGKTFKPKTKRNVRCSKECELRHRKDVRKARRQTIKCESCGNEFETNRKNARACSRKCIEDIKNREIREQRRIENDEKYKDVVDIPTCKICGWKSRSLQAHLITHNLTVQQYREKYGVKDEEIFHSSYTQEKSKRSKGENNPGYQHNGTMSSFSTRFKKYDGLAEAEKRERINRQVGKANETKEQNNGYNTRMEFYTKQGLSAEEAEQALTNRQRTFSLDICIEKHGEVDGIKRWQRRQTKWLATLDALPEKEKQRINKLKAEGARNNKTYSKISKELFEQIKRPESYFGLHEKTLFINDRYYRPDFLNRNKIIEFFGDYWHANPERYGENEVLNYPYQRMTAKEKWEHDTKRIAVFKTAGYEVLIVWESDYRKDPEGTIKKCLNFLNNE